MKKFFIFLLMHVGVVSAQGRVDDVMNHPPLISLYLETVQFCEPEIFMMALNPEASKIEEYEKCVSEKKRRVEGAFVASNKYLKEKGYEEARVSLRKFYKAALERLAEPPIYTKETYSEKSIRERRYDELKRASDVTWGALVTDIKIAE